MDPEFFMGGADAHETVYNLHAILKKYVTKIMS